MATHLEESLRREIARIRDHLASMAGLAEQALRDCVKALEQGNRQTAYSVILRDHKRGEFVGRIKSLGR